MAADSLLAALQGNYGDGDVAEDDINTVRGLLSFCKKWTQGRALAEELNDPCLAMAGRLRAGAEEMDADLRSNPKMAKDMRAPVARTMQAYRAIADVLDEFPEFAKEDNIDDFLDNLEVFDEQRQIVLDSQGEIQFQLSGQTLRCPKCGSAGDEADCPTCSLTRLYPDPAAIKARHQQARLPGLYGKVFRVYNRVIGGERSLSSLWDALVPLEEHLETLVSTRRRLAKRAASPKLSPQSRLEARTAELLLSSADEDVSLALKGVERMKGAEQTLKMSDMSRGWEDIFYAALSLEVTAARIRRRLGGDEPDSPRAANDDLISFSGE